MNARLSAGDKAPPLVTQDWQGHRFDLGKLQAQVVLLSFYRYASCPLCNLRIHQLTTEHDALTHEGLRMIAVFQSPAERIARYVGKQAPPFPIIPDPDMIFYRRFGVETSWRGFAHSWTLGIGKLIKAVFGNQYIPGTIEGDVNRIPADFLIGADGRILDAYYGADIGDHMPLQRLRVGLRLAATAKGPSDA